MNDQLKVMEHLTGLFKHVEQRLNGTLGSQLHKLQKNAMDQVSKVGFPDRRHEDWKYTPVQRLISYPYQIANPSGHSSITPVPSLECYTLKVINGKWIQDDESRQLTAAGITIKSLSESINDPNFFSTFPMARMDGQENSNQAFQFLNFALQAGAFVLDVPPHTQLDKPIEIRIIHDDAEVSVSSPLYFIQTGIGSEVTIFERFEHTSTDPAHANANLINAACYVALAPNAKMTLIRFQDIGEKQNLVYKLAVHQKRDSRFNCFSFDWGGALVRNNIDVDLQDQNTFTSLQAGFVAKQNQSMDHQTMINHAMPHCESHELYKGIVDDQASAAFNGKVFVRPDAQKTNAFQQNDTMVLSPHAVMNSKPQLEIFADDVKCSHGATIGQLDHTAMFYLRARGIDAITASHMLKAAFLSQVLDRVPVEPIQDYIRQKMNLDQ